MNFIREESVQMIFGFCINIIKFRCCIFIFIQIQDKWD